MPSKDSKIKRFFRKVGKTALSSKNFPEKLTHGVNNAQTKLLPKETKQEIPEWLRGFFKNRHASWPEYVMLKIQITLVLLFGLTAALILMDGPWIIFGPIFLLTSLYGVLITKLQLKIAFSTDYPAYRSFVGICIGIAWGAGLLLKYLPSAFEGLLLGAALPTVIVIAGAILAFIGFRLKYGRDYTYGVVRETKNDKAKVKVSYDLRSNVQQGVHFIDSFVPVEKGDVVKIKANRSMLGLKGSTVEAIVDKAPEREESFD